MKSILIISSIIFSMNAFAGGDSISGGGMLLQASFSGNTTFGITSSKGDLVVNSRGLALLESAALDLSGNDPIFAQDILDAYNPVVTESLIVKSPAMLANVGALLKISAGISFLDKTKYVEAEKVIDAISKDSSYIDSYRDVRLEDIYQSY
jgi:hypothetical protein